MGLTNLSTLVVAGNQLTNLTMPPDVAGLAGLVFDGDPLATFVLSEQLRQAPTYLALVFPVLRAQGVAVFTYPLAVSLVSPRRTLAGEFAFTLAGPPGIYALLSSTNLTTFSALGTVTNTLGSAIFTDGQAPLSSQKFYRAQLLTPP
jgi:hypothetical protein